jgi:hypothetical protein
MALPFAANTMKITLEYTIGGKVVINVYHVKKPTPIASIDLETVATAFWTWWTANIRGFMTSDVTLNKITALDLSDDSGTMFEYIPSSGNVGTDSPPTVSNNIALCVSMRTGNAGRSNRGRSYLFGFAEGYVDGNNISAGVAATLAGQFADLDDALETAGYSIGVLSYYHLGAVRGTPVFRSYASYSVNTRVDTQRRRLPTA